MPVEVIGIDHIYIAVSDLERSEAYYDVLMPLLGFRKNTFEIGGHKHAQYYNRHFGYVLRPASANAPAHDAYHPGLHHLCFRVETIDALQTLAREFHQAGVVFEAPRHFPQYAPDYHAIFLRDPDGMRLEITNYRQERRDRFHHWHDHGG